MGGDIGLTWEREDGDLRSISGETLALLIWALEQWVSRPEAFADAPQSGARFVQSAG